MAPRTSAELENALAANPAARERFWALPPEQKDAWVAFVERGRFPGARRRRAADAARRLGATAPAVEEGATAAPVALPRTDWTEWVIGLALLLGLAAFLLWLTVFRHHDHKKSTTTAAATSTVPKVTGIAVQSAKFQLQAAKLGSKVTRIAAAKPKGIVVAQAPKPGHDGPARNGGRARRLERPGPASRCRSSSACRRRTPCKPFRRRAHTDGARGRIAEAARHGPCAEPRRRTTLAKGAAVQLKVSKGAPKPTTTTVATTTHDRDHHDDGNDDDARAAHDRETTTPACGCATPSRRSRTDASRPSSST